MNEPQDEYEEQDLTRTHWMAAQFDPQPAELTPTTKKRSKKMKKAQDFKAPATPKNAAPDQKILYANIQKAQKEVEQRGALRTETNRQDPYAQEWTVEGKAIWSDTKGIGVAESQKEAKIIADAHKAALAAEREHNKTLVEVLKGMAENADHYADDYTEIDSMRTELRGFAGDLRHVAILLLDRMR
jgi:hypothetical protein